MLGGLIEDYGDWVFNNVGSEELWKVSFVNGKVQGKYLGYFKSSQIPAARKIDSI